MGREKIVDSEVASDVMRSSPILPIGGLPYKALSYWEYLKEYVYPSGDWKGERTYHENRKHVYDTLGVLRGSRHIIWKKWGKGNTYGIVHWYKEFIRRYVRMYRITYTDLLDAFEFTERFIERLESRTGVHHTHKFSRYCRKDVWEVGCDCAGSYRFVLEEVLGLKIPEKFSFWEAKKARENPLPSTLHHPVGYMELLKTPTILYRHFDEEGTLLYVGITARFARRTASHKRASEWGKLIHNITVEEFEDRRSAMDAEWRIIREERPKYNRAGVYPI